VKGCPSYVQCHSKVYLLLCRLWFYDCLRRLRSSTEIKAFPTFFSRRNGIEMKRHVCGPWHVCVDNWPFELFELCRPALHSSRTSPWSSGKCVRFGVGWSRVSAGSYQDLVNWYCSLLTRCTVCGRAAGNTPRTQNQTRNCTNSVVAQQDHCIIQRQQQTTTSKKHTVHASERGRRSNIPFITKLLHRCCRQNGIVNCSADENFLCV